MAPLLAIGCIPEDDRTFDVELLTLAGTHVRTVTAWPWLAEVGFDAAANEIVFAGMESDDECAMTFVALEGPRVRHVRCLASFDEISLRSSAGVVFCATADPASSIIPWSVLV
jgi:hypothetical protein